MISDYFLLRGARLDVDDLYRRDGAYEYAGGWNWRAVVALVVGVAVALVGLAAPGLRWLYDYAWFVGFVVSGGLYWILMQGARKQA